MEDDGGSIGLSKDDYEEFKTMLEEALLEIPLPSGIIDSDQIIPGSIRPQDCKLDADWNFEGNISASGVSLGGRGPGGPGLAVSEIQSEATGTTQNQGSLATSGSGSYGSTNSSSTNTTPSLNQTSNGTSTEVVLLDALREKIIYTLPPAAKNPNKMLYVKRVDTQSRNICRIETFEDDKIDSEERIIMAVQEAVVLIAASGKWHILSRYTPPQDVQNLNVSHVSNVNTKVMLLTTD